MKKDTEGNWTQNNPVLLNGEIILVDTDSGELRAKVGDGTKTYTQLPFTDEILKNLITGKQNKLTGSQGQVVGFDAEGNAVAQEAPQGGLTQEQADQMYVKQQNGSLTGGLGLNPNGTVTLQQGENADEVEIMLAYGEPGNPRLKIYAGASYMEFNANDEQIRVSNPVNSDNVANKWYVDREIDSIDLPLAFGPQTVASSAWASDSTYSDYPYRASIALSGVTANHVPSVNFNSSDALSGKLSPVSESYDGGVYIYATEALTEAVSVGSVTCIKAVSA